MSDDPGYRYLVGRRPEDCVLPGALERQYAGNELGHAKGRA